MMLAAIFAALALIFGATLSISAIMGHGLMAAGGPDPIVDLVFGVGAVVMLPLLNGTGAFLMGVLLASLYNLVAKITGGLAVELESQVEKHRKQS